MSLLFNMLSRFVITFLPESKHLLISWLKSPSAVILEPERINSLSLVMVENSWTWLAPIGLSTNVQPYPILSSYRWKYCLPCPFSISFPWLHLLEAGWSWGHMPKCGVSQTEIYPNLSRWLVLLFWFELHFHLFLKSKLVQLVKVLAVCWPWLTCENKIAAEQTQVFTFRIKHRRVNRLEEVLCLTLSTFHSFYFLVLLGCVCFFVAFIHKWGETILPLKIKPNLMLHISTWSDKCMLGLFISHFTPIHWNLIFFQRVYSLHLLFNLMIKHFRKWILTGHLFRKGDLLRLTKLS